MAPINPPVYFAHSGKAQDRSDWQRLEDHLEQTAQRAKAAGLGPGLPLCAETAARLHDFGKYDPAFQKRLQGDPKSVDHSTAGGSLLRDLAGPTWRFIADLLGHAILGHHAGLPDSDGSDSGMQRRIDGFHKRNPIPPEITAAQAVDFRPLMLELQGKARRDDKKKIGFDISLAGRMIFSCLVDADFKDTEAYYDPLEGRHSDRAWRSLPEILPDLRARFDVHMAGIAAKAAERTDAESRKLNGLRADILAHIRAQAPQKPGLFTLTVPTGGGKTLASMGFALDHAALHGHRRIIYAIPYTSIIDQTAKTFREIFGEEVLEHHSAIDIDKDQDKEAQQGRDKLRLAMEDWAAPIVVTTNVQLFESLFAARPSRCRKVHNIAGSIIVLDEAQCLPRDLLAPTLRMIEALAALYDCTILLCTATQPAFDSAQLKEIGLPLAGRELAPEPSELARRLRRTRILHGGAMDDAALTDALREAPQSMVVVNSRRHALELFKAAQAEGLEGLIHLTTRQYPAHRRQIIEDLRARLKPNSAQACRLIATSLIEAGVDLDFPKGWRAETGVDSIVQAAGRVNREGRRPIEESTLTVFEAAGRSLPQEIEQLAKAMRGVARKFGYENLLTPEAIQDWFNEVYWSKGPERMGQAMADAFKYGSGGTAFPYRSTAAVYHMIKSEMVPVVVAREEKALKEVAKLTAAHISSGAIARELQVFTVQIPTKARDLLVGNGHARFHAPDLRGDQFCVLESASLYSDEIGLWWENGEYLNADASFI